MDDRVVSVAYQMAQQMDRELTVSAPAASVGLSVTHLMRLVRADTGRTPGAFLRAPAGTRASARGATLDADHRIAATSPATSDWRVGSARPFFGCRGRKLRG